MNLEADFLWIPKLLLFPSLSISSFVQTPSGTWKRWTFCWKAHCLGTYFQCLIHSNLCNLNWIFPVIWVEDFFSLLWFLFQLVVSRSKKGNKEQMFLLHPQLLWAQMWQKRLLRRGIMFSYWHSAPRVTRAASAGQILCFFLVYSFLSHSGSDNVLKCNSRIRANHQYNLSVL